MTIDLDAIRALVEGVRGALALAATDLPCENGCGCEGYDYCAQDGARDASKKLDALLALVAELQEQLAAKDKRLRLILEAVKVGGDCGSPSCVSVRQSIGKHAEAALAREAKEGQA